jgi:hypothetical protein
MQFMLSLISEERSWEDVTPEEMKRTIAEMGQFNAELTEAGAFVAAGGLQERATGTTVRFDAEGESVVSDGPFAETKEQLAGFWLIECESLDEALAWVRKCPVRDGAIEIRPMVGSTRELIEKVEAS